MQNDVEILQERCCSEKCCKEVHWKDFIKHSDKLRAKGYRTEVDLRKDVALMFLKHNECPIRATVVVEEDEEDEDEGS